MQGRQLLFTLAASLVAVVLTVPAYAQNLTSGDVVGTITDPSGAILPNATVALKNNGTSQTQTRITNATGAYRFSLLTPGAYTVSANASGFQTISRPVTVAVGQAPTVDMRLSVGSSSQTVEVTAEAGVVQTQNGNISTTFTPNRYNSYQTRETI